MITKDNFKKVLECLSFTKNNDIYTKKFVDLDCELKVDFKNKKLIFPEDKGLIVNDKTTSNFNSAENFVVFECVHRLLCQGYSPRHIELEKKWQLGHSQKSGKADIFIKDNDGNSVLIIECKTAGSEYKKAIDILENDAKNQLFSYLQQATSTKFISLYASNFENNKVVPNYYLINVTDNEELLKNDIKLKSYKEATTTEEKYQVWCDTYDKEYATVGIFEDNKPYDIGKTKFTINDLKDISSSDIQGKYHTFASILRQHNVSGRENAFDKLVNLFLCKVTDEKENSNELKFNYKGKAYDTPFDFQDRLQNLYKTGMGEFLDDEITYIPNSEIDKAFDVFKNRPNATKEQIKKFVRELKFFTNNDFAFIEVHNEKLFYQNFEILLKVSRMIEEICLTCTQENQLLGDMFEGFLDQGIKQSEGQYFTPIPIVKFIINSLPKKEAPKVIDYACGAGHFLNEYARKYPNSEIVGIEKEYRLSKVSKISSFMYGRDMDIIYNDALLDNNKLHLKDEDFDVLIANPPYSVKGFLQTLGDEDRQSYELIDAVDSKSYSKTGAIECFFIEKAKQLLKKDAVAGIILPSSILNKDTPKLYTKTREIILKYFDIVAIAEFGSGTFGKTGTNTVALFLRKRGVNPELSHHYQNMVNSWFECDFELNRAFKDDGILEKYCSYIEIDFEGYKNLLCDKIDNILFENETFKEYKAVFEKSTETKARKKKKYYKLLSKQEQDTLEEKHLIEFIKSIEKDKLIYFSLASKQTNDVVIIKSPTKKDKIKQFLGYEWGGRKGNEGIKYLASVDISSQIDKDELDIDDKRVIENLQGLKGINTVLYNPSNSEDVNKINKIIKDNFANIKTSIPECLNEFVSRSKLVDMLDFRRVDFNKEIGLSHNRKVNIEFLNNLNKYPKEKLSTIVQTNPSKTEISKVDKDTQVSFIEMASVSNNGYIEMKINKPLYELKKGSYTYFKENDIIIAKITPSMENGKCAIATNLTNNIGMGSSEFHVLRCSDKIINKYLFVILNTEKIRIEAEQHMTGASGHRRVPINFYEDLSIPLAPINIQEKIINECQKIDNEIQKANNTISELKEIIENDFYSLSKNTNNALRLSDENLFHAFIGKRVLSEEIEQNPKNGIVVYSANVFEPFGYTQKEFIKDFSKDSVLWGIDGDWMVNYIPKNKPFYPTDHCGVIRVKTDKIHPRYLAWILNKVGEEKRFSRSNRASTARVKALTIKAPSIEEQNKLVEKIEKLELKINKAKKVINGAKSKKEEILEKYLK